MVRMKDTHSLCTQHDPPTDRRADLRHRPYATARMADMGCCRRADLAELHQSGPAASTSRQTTRACGTGSPGHFLQLRGPATYRLGAVCTHALHSTCPLDHAQGMPNSRREPALAQLGGSREGSCKPTAQAHVLGSCRPGRLAGQVRPMGQEHDRRATNVQLATVLGGQRRYLQVAKLAGQAASAAVSSAAVS
jgi:hypothetical protein